MDFNDLFNQLNKAAQKEVKTVDMRCEKCRTNIKIKETEINGIAQYLCKQCIADP